MGQLDAGFAHVQKIAVVEGLQAQVVKLQVPAGLERSTQAGQVKLQQFGVQQLVVNGFLDEAGKVVDIRLRHVGLGNVFAQRFLGHGVKQQARGGVGVVGVFLDQGTGRQDRGFVHLVHGHAVVQIAHGFRHDGVRLDVGAQPCASGFDDAFQPV